MGLLKGGKRKCIVNSKKEFPDPKFMTLISKYQSTDCKVLKKCPKNTRKMKGVIACPLFFPDPKLMTFDLT